VGDACACRVSADLDLKVKTACENNWRYGVYNIAGTEDLIVVLG
jgi:hypothetical protein